LSTDSAGQPWQGRTFHEAPPSDDDGTAPPHLIAAITTFKQTGATEEVVVDALRTSRLLIPLVAHLGEAGENEHGQLVDKTQELSIVTVVGPDGRTVMPAFTSVDAMRAWNPTARPIPAEAARVALAAVSEGTDIVILDPRSPTEFAVRRPALAALAQSLPWVPCYMDEAVRDEFVAAIDSAGNDDWYGVVNGLGLSTGDPDGTLAGPELLLRLHLRPGLDAEALGALVARLQDAWSRSELIAERVDSMTMQLVPSA
jgi:hypothetical protein